MKNKKIVWIIIGIVAIALIALAITYAYWQITKTQEGVNEITAACLDITLADAEEGNTGISLTNQYPLSDTEGAALNPYKFTVTNNCDTEVNYQIALESIGDSADAMQASSIKVMLDSNTATLLSENDAVSPTVSGAYASHKIGMGTLAAKDSEGDSVTHELRLWIDEDAPVSEADKTFESKISVTIGQGIVAGNTLATLIMNDAEANNYLYSTTPDFSKVTADGEYGLYTAQDDYGTSYYYRGDVENNYVKFGPEAYVSTYLPKDVDLTSICGEDTECISESSSVSSLVFQTEESCKISGKSFGIWETCEESEIETVYTPMMESLEYITITQTSIGYVTEEACNASLAMTPGAASSMTCTEKTINQESLKKYEQLTWRIVRINGDETVRLVYDGTSAVANGENHVSAIGDSAYNTNYNDAKYVGYTYDDGNGNQVDSTIKGVLDTWYENNLKKDYGKYLADSIFCNDREVSSTSGSETYYAAYDRLYTNKSPILTCSNQSDRYTADDTTLGNGILTNPIGLLTADEIAMAGGVYDEFSLNNYLYSSSVYWTSSTYGFVYNGAYMFSDNIGSLYYNAVPYNYNAGVRPVINLKSDTLFTGSGTIDNPYKLVEQ